MNMSVDDDSFTHVSTLLQKLHPGINVSADKFREQFGSGNAMFSASTHLLHSIGLSESDALLLSNLSGLCRYTDRTQYAKVPVLNTLPSAAVYLVNSLRSLSEERFCLLCLDKRGRLIADITLQDGTDDSALFSLRALLAEVIRTGPYAVILSHNHPRHTLQPSREDIACTREAIRALTVLAIPMLDHIIVAGQQAVSIRDNGFLPAELWIDQSPDNILLKAWLDQ